MRRKPLMDEVKLGVFVLLILAMLAYLSVKIGGIGGGESIQAFVFFDDIAGLVKDAAVNIAGVRVGTVRGLSVEGRRAKVTITITPDAMVRRDAVATIRAKSLLGEKYLEIIPQSDTAPLLKSGDSLTKVVEATDVDQVITRMKPLLDGLVSEGPGKPGLLEDFGVLTKLLRATLTDAQAALPDTLRNLRDLTGDMKTMAAKNKEKLSETLEATHRLAESSADLLERHEKQISRTVENADKITADFAAHSREIARNLATISANVAAASAKFPELAETLSRLCAKLDVTLDCANRLLPRLETIDLVLVRTILQEEGIKVNMFGRKVKEEGTEGQEKKDKGFLWFGKPAPGKGEAPEKRRD
jgi:phospholipid/cholesterol/gamma-HCH transport system substrate-binding protein